MIGNITAQSGGVGIHAGVVGTALYNLEDGPDEQFETNSGIMVGVRYNLKFGPIGFCPELNYVSKKYGQIGEYDYLNNVSEWTNPNEWTLNYISMPLLLKLYLGPVNIHAGPQFSYLLGGSLKDSELGINTDFTDDEYYYTIDGEEYWLWNDVDIAGVFGIGVDLKMGLYIAARATVSVTPLVNLDSADDSADTDQLQRTFTSEITIGYSF
tara:strand:- start:869 stop:1501 length:633 start_codon:yes stop_codon:yes gene_type:complete